MSAFTETVVNTFHVVHCYTCGIPFGIESALYRRVVTDADGSVYCPACGKGTQWTKSQAQIKIEELERKLKWEADNAARQRAAREKAEASLMATKGVVTRMRRRASAGTCPCCSRTFKQLAAHMAEKHPEFVEPVKSP